MHPADRHPDVANLHTGSVMGAAFRLYRREPARVAGAALVLLFPAIVLGAGTGRLLDAYRDGPLDDRLVLILVAAALAAVLANVGTIVYAGVLERLVGSVIRGGQRPSIGEAARSLPIWSLIGADLAVTALVGLASALGVLPGFLLIALLGIVGPVVNIERRRPLAAIRRSLGLTWPHLWLTVLSIGLPLAVEVLAHHWLLHVRHEADVVVELLVSLPLILTVGAFVGLTEIELAYALLARDDGSPVATIVAETAPPELGRTTP
ncbi:MAG: hypothetical protein ACRDGK_01325 [Actinomycetota bacterium]